jgi:hypothetical protein
VDPEVAKGLTGLVEHVNATLKGLTDAQTGFATVADRVRAEYQQADERALAETETAFEAAVAEIDNVDLFGKGKTVNFERGSDVRKNRSALIKAAGALMAAHTELTGDELPVGEAVNRAYAAQFTKEATAQATAEAVDEHDKKQKRHRKRRIGRPSSTKAPPKTPRDEAIEEVTRVLEEGAKK